MSDPVISPDGELIWDGNDWVPLPSQLNSNVQDSVVMGDVNNKVENSIHNSFSQDTEKMVRNHLNLIAEKMRLGQFKQSQEIYEKAKQIDYDFAIELYEGEFREIMVRNHLHLVAEKMELGQFEQADGIYERAKQIDHELAIRLYEGEFCEIFVDKQWSALSSHSMISDLYNSDISGVKARKFLEYRVSKILVHDNDHFESLLLMTKISIKRIGTNWFTTGNSITKAEYDCNRLLSLRPNSKIALDGIKKVEYMKKFYFFQWIGMTFAALLILYLLIF